jgi:Na+/H+ antiporter NhaD/arsenite permease-like protein
MQFAIISICIVGYLCIFFEDKIHINKAVPAIVSAILAWTVFINFTPNPHEASHKVAESFGEVCQIAIFVFCAVTIVKFIEYHQGFDLITKQIKTRNPIKLLWITCFLTFIMAPIIDNLTAALVMHSILCNLLPGQENQKVRRFFVCINIVASNAGGTWSVIGVITSTMLWNGGQVTGDTLFLDLFVPSVMSLAVPLVIISLLKKKYFQIVAKSTPPSLFRASEHSPISSKIALLLGIGSLAMVPVFKILLHQPPYLALLFALGLLWSVLFIFFKQYQPMPNVMSQVDLSGTVLFFLGILLMVDALAVSGVLANLAIVLDSSIENWAFAKNLDSWLAHFEAFKGTAMGSKGIISTFLGLSSAVVDNVPLVAATQKMYDLSSYPINHPLWLLLSFTVGTGGSILVMGSAAGVGVMGEVERQENWENNSKHLPYNFHAYYAKTIGIWAIIGYFVGIFTYYCIKII